MNFDWNLLITAVGLAFILEGIPYFLFAERMPRMLIVLASRPSRSLRIMGLTAMILGVLLISLGRSF